MAVLPGNMGKNNKQMLKAACNQIVIITKIP